ncbi:MAG: TolC family protein [Nitrospinae bacterium]|nr:TolC family protein [Nitrospinota bacterium]
MFWTIKAVVLGVALAAIPAAALAEDLGALALEDVIRIGMERSPQVKAADEGVTVEAESENVARGERWFRVDAQAAATRYRYDSPLTPISGIPGPGSTFPDFANPVYDAVLSFSFPLYRGGRLERNVAIAGLRRDVAENMAVLAREELKFNLTSVYYKILQLQRSRVSGESTVKQLDAHYRDTGLFVKSGAAARLDLLKTDAELKRAQHNLISIENGISATMETLRALMGMDDSITFTLKEAEGEFTQAPGFEEALGKALAARPEISAARSRGRILEEKAEATWGKHLPSVTVTADYGGRAADDGKFNENWTASLKMAAPVFDAGMTSAEVARDRAELMRAREELRGLELNVRREVKEASLMMDTSGKKVEVARAAVQSAAEALSVENLKYAAGAGSTRDVLDASATLSRAEAEYHQAIYEKNVAGAMLEKAMGGGLDATGGSR